MAWARAAPQVGRVRYEPGGQAVALSTVPASSPQQVWRGAHGDPSYAVRPATGAGHTHAGLNEPPRYRAAVHRGRDPQARDSHRDGQPGVGAPADARRTRQARSPDRGLHGVTDPA